MSDLRETAAELLSKVREVRPLVHNITNFVVMNYTANALLSMGASPVMAHAPNEVEEMAAIAGALALNIGTLTDDWVESMIIAGKKASELGKPIILDPVGSGATTLRTRAAKQILRETDIRVIRGNASEILSLQSDITGAKGVDSVHQVEDAMEQAQRIALDTKATVAITGAVDFVTEGSTVLRVKNGHPLMACVTGTGCTATAIIAAFLAVEPDALIATTAALAYFGAAGEKAADRAKAPGSFAVELIDALYTLTPEEFHRLAVIE